MSISLSSKDEEMTDLFQGIEIAGNEKVVGRRLPRFQFGPSFWFWSWGGVNLQRFLELLESFCDSPELGDDEG